MQFKGRDQVVLGIRVAEQWHPKFLGSGVIRVEGGVVEVSLPYERHQVGGPKPQFPHRPPQLSRHRLRMASRHRRHRQQPVFVSPDQLTHPVVVLLAKHRPHRSRVGGGQLDAGGEEQLQVDALAVGVAQPELHVPTSLLAAGHLSTPPIGVGVVDQRMVEGATDLLAPRIELVRKACVLIRPSPIGLGVKSW